MNKASILSISKSVSSGITPLRSNQVFWSDVVVPWLKTNQVGEKCIYETDEKISDVALNNTTIKLNPANTLSIAMYGEGKTRGNISILKTPMTTNQACCNIVIDEKKADYEYVYYFLKTQYEYLRNLSSGVRKNLNSSDIKNFEIRLPESVVTQKKIATVLSTLDKKIALNNRINTELEAMAKTLYDYWFVQFDFPISEAQASALGKPELKGKPYKTSGGKMVFNEALKREIPEGWEVGEFSNYARVKSGFAFKSSWWTDIGIPVLKIKDILENYTLNTGGFSFVNEDMIKIANNFISKPGDVVIAMTGATIGKFGVIPHSEKPILINQRVGLYDLGESPFNKLPFLVNSMKQDFFRFKVFQVATGAAQPNISGEQLDSFPLIFPDNNLIKTYNDTLVESYKLIANNIQQNQQLTQLRDWLLPMLMNGQVTVNE